MLRLTVGRRPDVLHITKLEGAALEVGTMCILSSVLFQLKAQLVTMLCPFFHSLLVVAQTDCSSCAIQLAKTF